MRWLITNRNLDNTDGFGDDLADLTYWTADPTTNPDLTKRSSWKELDPEEFRDALAKVANTFPHPVKTSIADQKHLCLFIHGYNESFVNSAVLYNKIASTLFDDDAGLGELISFDWPSKGSLLGYLPDRATARKVADDITNVFEELYNWMSDKQVAAANDIHKACRARTSVIAHSMGNYVLQYGLESLWTRKNRPLLVSLLQEVLMIAADVDNDIFRAGENISHGDGEGLANLSYRITALYSGRDDVLGSSAGLKHFGKRRLGRSGIDRTYPLPDNVWDIDCSTLLLQDVNGLGIHGEYFEPRETTVYSLMRRLLQGTDRSVLIASGEVPLGNQRVQQLGIPPSSPTKS